MMSGQQNLVFVSHTTDNKIYIFNKSTFTAYTTPYLDGAALGWNTPRSIAVTSDGDLWVTCKNTSGGQWQVLRYTNFGGTPSVAATVTVGLVNPIGLAVSLDGNKTLMVTDGETSSTVCQQIRLTLRPARPCGPWARPAAMPATARRSPTTSSSCRG